MEADEPVRVCARVSEREKKGIVFVVDATRPEVVLCTHSHDTSAAAAAAAVAVAVNQSVKTNQRVFIIQTTIE